MQTKEIEYFKLFRDVCKKINSSLNLQEVLDLIAESVVKVINVKACTVFLWDKKGNTLEVSATHGLSEAYLKKGPLEADKSIAETLDGEVVVILNADSDPRIQYPEAAKNEGKTILQESP